MGRTESLRARLSTALAPELQLRFSPCVPIRGLNKVLNGRSDKRLDKWPDGDPKGARWKHDGGFALSIPYSASRKEAFTLARYFEYATDAIEYLKAKDKKLGAAIDAVGVVRREMDEDDLFTAIVHQIIGQQISTAAQATIWNRMRERLGEVTPSAVCAATEEELQSCGITFTKARYIKSCAEKVASGQFDLDAVREMDDAEAIAALSSLEGVGVWTAEMLLLFCLGRPDILSYGDLAIRRGMRMVYHHRKVTREMFERYRRRYSPYGSVASLYLWAISSMNVPGYERDFAPKKARVAKKGKLGDGAVGAKG